MIKFTKYISKMNTYDSADDKKIPGLNLEAWERLFAYKYLKNANHGKYGNFLKHLRE